jgi:hypothetical protein
MEVSGQLDVSAAFQIEKRAPDIHWIGSWKSLGVGLDVEAMIVSARNRSPVVESIGSYYPSSQH